MKTFPWPTRLKFGVLAALAGWVAGWAASIPFELGVAWRYVDAHARQLPEALTKGFVVWAVFCLLMAMAGFVPIVLPLVLLLSPAWIVRWRRLLIPAAPLAAIVAIDQRMALLHAYQFRHPKAIVGFFFTAPNFFAITFALVVVWAYVILARRRLSEA
jgi:hypothetical protein